MKFLIIGIGGFMGANARYLIDGWVQNRVGPGFPYGTFFVNVTGCFLIGVFATLALRLAWSDEWRLLVVIGFIGAYTTFSTVEYETLRMLSEGLRWRAAVFNVAGSAIVGLAAVYLGVVAARLLIAMRH